MMMKQGLENQFNKAGGKFGYSGEGRDRSKKLRDMEYAEVVAELNALDEEQKAGALDEQKQERYNDLNELYEKMEKAMEAIEKDPTSFESILTYGNAPLKSLEEVTKNMVTVQGKFAEQVNVMARALDGVDGKMAQLKEFGTTVKDTLGRIAKVGGKAGGGLLKGLGKLLNAGKQKTDDEKFVEDMQSALPEKVREMQILKIEMDKTEKGLGQVMQEAEKLGMVRADTTLELGVYVNAAKEVLRRYNEVYIKEAQDEYDQTQHPDDGAYLETLIERRDDFAGRMLTLKGSQMTGNIAMEQLRRIITTLKDQRKKIEDIRVNGIPEWTALIVEAGIAGSSLKISQAIAKSDKTADEMFELVQGMIEKSDEMTRNARARGTIDPDKLIEAANRMKNLLDKDLEDKKKRLEAVEETYNKLDEAHAKLLEAVDNKKQARLLESDTARAPTPASNDNSEAPKTEDKTEQAPTRRRRGGNGLSK